MKISKDFVCANQALRCVVSRLESIHPKLTLTLLQLTSQLSKTQSKKAKRLVYMQPKSPFKLHIATKISNDNAIKIMREALMMRFY